MHARAISGMIMLLHRRVGSDGTALTCCAGQVLAGGENVYCTEVEAALAAHPAVGAPEDAHVVA